MQTRESQPLFPAFFSPWNKLTPVVTTIYRVLGRRSGGLSHRPRRWGKAGHGEVAAVAGHDGTKTTQGMGSFPTLAWAWAAAEDMGARGRSQGPRRGASSSAGTRAAVADGNAMRTSSSNRRQGSVPCRAASVEAPKVVEPQRWWNPKDHGTQR